jgi:hypothetical protein
MRGLSWDSADDLREGSVVDSMPEAVRGRRGSLVVAHRWWATHNRAIERMIGSTNRAQSIVALASPRHRGGGEDAPDAASQPFLRQSARG